MWIFMNARIKMASEKKDFQKSQCKGHGLRNKKQLQNLKEPNLVGLNHPSEMKNMLVKLDHFPK